MLKVPFFSLQPQHEQIRDSLLQAFENVIDKGSFILGDQLLEFEKAYAAFSGCRFAAGVGSGFDGLVLSLRALGIGTGDEVIVPSHTCVATWLAVSATGARPVPVEPDMATYNIDPAKIDDAITKDTKIILPVHLYGLACDMTSILMIARNRGLFVVEDNAQGHGAMHNGQLTGSFGRINATSFYPTKNLGALADGGATTTNDLDLDQKVRMLRNYGSQEKDHVKILGVNSRLDEIQAAMLRVKLARLSSQTDERIAIAERYQELKDTGDLVLPHLHNGSTHVYHRFVIRTTRRDLLKSYLEENGIGTMIHYPTPPHLQPGYAALGYRKGQFPIAETLASTCLSLPLWPGMTEQQVAQVIGVVKRFWD